MPVARHASKSTRGVVVKSPSVCSASWWPLGPFVWANVRCSRERNIGTLLLAMWHSATAGGTLLPCSVVRLLKHIPVKRLDSNGDAGHWCGILPHRGRMLRFGTPFHREGLLHNGTQL